MADESWLANNIRKRQYHQHVLNMDKIYEQDMHKSMTNNILNHLNRQKIFSQRRSPEKDREKLAEKEISPERSRQERSFNDRQKSQPERVGRNQDRSQVSISKEGSKICNFKKVRKSCLFEDLSRAEQSENKEQPQIKEKIQYKIHRLEKPTRSRAKLKSQSSPSRKSLNKSTEQKRIKESNIKLAENIRFVNSNLSREEINKDLAKYRYFKKPNTGAKQGSLPVTEEYVTRVHKGTMFKTQPDQMALVFGKGKGPSRKQMEILLKKLKEKKNTYEASFYPPVGPQTSRQTKKNKRYSTERTPPFSFKPKRSLPLELSNPHPPPPISISNNPHPNQNHQNQPNQNQAKQANQNQPNQNQPHQNQGQTNQAHSTQPQVHHSPHSPHPLLSTPLALSQYRSLFSLVLSSESMPGSNDIGGGDKGREKTVRVDFKTIRHREYRGRETQGVWATVRGIQGQGESDAEGGGRMADITPTRIDPSGSIFIPFLALKDNYLVEFCFNDEQGRSETILFDLTKRQAKVTLKELTGFQLKTNISFG